MIMVMSGQGVLGGRGAGDGHSDNCWGQVRW